MRIGEVISKSLENFKRKYQELVPYLPQSFGYGMGYEFKEKDLVLSIKNQVIIEDGMSFNVIVSLENIDTGRQFKTAL